MKKDRLVHFRKKLEEKYQQLVEEVGKNVMYGKVPRTTPSRTLGTRPAPRTTASSCSSWATVTGAS